AGVDGAFGLRAGQRRRARAHGPRRARDLVGGLALHAQRDQKAPDLRRRRLSVHDAPEDRGDLLGGEGPPQEEPRQRRRYFHSPMKFLSSALPAGVMIDSGWNCTPSTGVGVPAQRRARTPMISSSQVLAVTSSASGTVWRSMTSEW